MSVIHFIFILLLSSVSTGVFLVNTFILFLVCILKFRILSLKFKINLFFLLPFLSIIIKLYFMKNYIYHGSLISMLDHGLGRVLMVDKFIILVTFIIAFVIALLYINFFTN